MQILLPQARDCMVADQTADRKSVKYADFTASYVSEPFAVENLGHFSASALEFISNLGQRISNLSGNDRETQFLFQRISDDPAFWLGAFVQLLWPRSTRPIGIPALFLTSVFNPRELLIQRVKNYNNTIWITP